MKHEIEINSTRVLSFNYIFFSTKCSLCVTLEQYKGSASDPAFMRHEFCSGTLKTSEAKTSRTRI